MSQHSAFLDRMTQRLDQLDARMQDLVQRAQALDTPQARRAVDDLQASLAVTRERLQELRRMGADLTDETTRSFTASFDRLNAAFGRTTEELR
jgi:chromosome segregation ATPase